MKVCVVGSGGREHALAHVFARTADVVVTPGNPGMAASGVRCTPLPAAEIEADLVVIGPEGPLVAGLGDELRAKGRLVFGPSADGAQLEGSKTWMKDLLAEAGVPTAAYGSFSDRDAAFAFLDGLPGAYVIKTDGLAAGKGVLVTDALEEARDAVDRYLSGEAFGDSGRTLVIEEAMVGPELSVLAVCDGTRAVALAPAQDFKRIGDDDAGPNTGGMGAYSPVPVAGASVVDQVMATAVEPTLAALRARGIDYRGVLYAGLMLTPDGPKIIEYNVRFGDPESQVVLPLFESDLVELLVAAARGSITDEPTFSAGAAVTVVLAAEGYPSAPRTGDLISGLDQAGKVEGVTVFHAGVAADAEGHLVTAGGRVLDVTAQGATIAEARNRAYEAVAAISWPGMQYRTDIARLATQQEQQRSAS